jgi:putative methanogenesis marker protein 17
LPEKIFVESLDETYQHGFGILIYKIIAEYILSDLAVGQAIQQMRVLVDIKKPIFAVSVRLSLPRQPIRMKDYARLEEETDGIHIIIHDETYAPELLQVLWNSFGKNNVTQIDRWETVIPPNLTTINELQNVIVADPKEKMMEKILDAITRIIPEAFRIERLLPEASGLTIISSENPIQEEWIETVKAALAQPPKLIPPKRFEEIKREPKKTEEIHKPWKKPIMT